MRSYFCGWYFKCQSEEQTLALIPAIHESKNTSLCSVQLITDSEALNFTFPHECFRKGNGFHIGIGGSYFGKNGIRIDLKAPGISATGAVRFGELAPIRYDIMGPFRYVPFMECRHSVVSMKHSVDGALRINGRDYRFRNAVGYIEGDRGCSFPKQYAWTQCFSNGSSLMLSVADIPIGRLRFTGVICVILWRGKEYRLATYLGAKAVKIRDGEITIKQGNTVLSVELLKRRAHPLAAPVDGVMMRTIHESAACRAHYRLEIGSETVFDFVSDKASFEYEYPT